MRLTYDRQHLASFANPEANQDEPWFDEVDFTDASEGSVETVMRADPDLEWGMTRSQWVWLRFPNGDLMLACFPQDDLYFEFEEEHS